MINAIKTIFPKARIVGCLFHYMQSLIRHAKKLGYRKKNHIEQMLDLVNSKLSILPFKYNGNIIEIKKEIDKFKLEYQNFNEFLSYYEKEWIPFFNNNMLKYRDKPKNERTNNDWNLLMEELKK